MVFPLRQNSTILLSKRATTAPAKPAASTGGPRDGRVLPGLAADSVAAAVETDPVPNGGDAADDPAIWVNTRDPSRSTVIGTDKEGGLAVYDLGGKQLQYLPHGRMNNVDLRDGFRLAGAEVTLGTASNRDTNTIAIYKVDPNGVASVFLKDDEFKGAGVNLNGIVYSQKGYLLVIKKSTGKVQTMQDCPWILDIQPLAAKS